MPTAGPNVQHWLPETSPEDDEPDSYVSVVCLACTRLHFIHKKPENASVRTDTSVPARTQGSTLSSLLYCSPGTDSAAVRNRIGRGG